MMLLGYGNDMNERIRELAEQARLLTGWPNGQVEYQKFAELIVQECCDQLRREWYQLNAETIDDPFADPRATGIHIGQKTGTIRCISRIKEHFGVE